MLLLANNEIKDNVNVEVHITLPLSNGMYVNLFFRYYKIFSWVLFTVSLT